MVTLPVLRTHSRSHTHTRTRTLTRSLGSSKTPAATLNMRKKGFVVGEPSENALTSRSYFKKTKQLPKPFACARAHMLR